MPQEEESFKEERDMIKVQWGNTNQFKYRVIRPKTTQKQASIWQYALFSPYHKGYYQFHFRYSPGRILVSKLNHCWLLWNVLPLSLSVLKYPMFLCHFSLNVATFTTAVLAQEQKAPTTSRAQVRIIIVVFKR
jgi:hypothetical protein